MEAKVNYSLHYKRWSKGTKEEMESKLKFYERLVGDNLVGLEKNIKILDYGCGYGGLTYYLQKTGWNISGVDASIEQVEVAKGLGLPVRHLPIEQFTKWVEEQREQYDVIFLMDVLEHIPHEEQISFFRRLVETLKPKGQIYVKVPNANSTLAMRWRYIDWTHYSSFTECSLDFVLLNAGLGDITYLNDESSLVPRFWYIPRPSVLRFYLKSFLRFLTRIYFYAEHGREARKFPLGLNLFVRASK